MNKITPTRWISCTELMKSGHNDAYFAKASMLKKIEICNCLITSWHCQLDDVSTLCTTCHKPLSIRQPHSLYSSTRLYLSNASISTSIDYLSTVLTTSCHSQYDSNKCAQCSIHHSSIWLAIIDKKTPDLALQTYPSIVTRLKLMQLRTTTK